jgi:hypothetical protein
MKRNKKNILCKAGVLLIAVVMMFSVIPAVTAETELNPRMGTMFRPTEASHPTGRPLEQSHDQYYVKERINEAFGGVGAEGDSIYLQPPFDGGSAATSIRDDAYPAYYECADSFSGLTECIGSMKFWGLSRIYSGGWQDCDPTPGMIFDIRFYDEAGPGEPDWANPVHFFDNVIPTSVDSQVWWGTDTLWGFEVDLPTDVTLTSGYVSVQADYTDGSACWWLWMNSDTGDFHAWQLQDTIGAELEYDLAFELYACGGGPGPVGECLDDQCDFAILALNNAYMYNGQINSLPNIINITIVNNGEVGINEVKILAQVYKKVCGPTVTLKCDPKHDLRCWCDEASTNFKWCDDDCDENHGKGDTWVLQGGEGNRWLTNNQAWRCTAGEDRSYGGDTDTYLGLSDNAVGTDDLILDPDDPKENNISGAACATLEFWHWCEGEWTTDGEGNVIPVDYGTIAYCLNGSATYCDFDDPCGCNGYCDGCLPTNWVEIPISQFVAYDTAGEWQKITVKFLNTAIIGGTTYADVCDDCDPSCEDNEIVIEAEFPEEAYLQFKWSWHKDPCYQFEGWYIDGVCLTRTEMYDLELVHQTYEIMPMDGCDPEFGPQPQYLEFELGWDPEPDTWYWIEVCGQVFSPMGCELITDNNCIDMQFEVTDVYDVRCVDMQLVSTPPFRPGDSITVNMTVKNEGTYAVDDIPISLKVADCVLDRAVDWDFETDPSGDLTYTRYTSADYDGWDAWRWTRGDSSIDQIYDIDSASARSVLPGSESLICGDDNSPGMLPTLKEGLTHGVTDDTIYDVADAMSATLKGYTKWSLEIEQFYDSWYYVWTTVPGSEGARAGYGIHPTEGPDSDYVFFYGIEHPDGGNSWVHTGAYLNDWEFFEVDLKEAAESFAYVDCFGEEHVPPIEVSFIVSTSDAHCTAYDGDTSNPLNPLPWSGFMLDNIVIEVVSCGGTTTTVFENATTGTLAPGDETNLFLTWNDAEYCNHCLIGDANAGEDSNPENDICSLCVLVTEVDPTGDFQSIDLTGEGDCLWHLCPNREGGDDTYAWAGVEEPHWAHYVHDMDDSFISPKINLSVCAESPYYGCSVNFTTWYKFFNTDDFGQVYARGAANETWKLLKTFNGNSDGYFVDVGADEGLWIPPEMCTEETQIRFRMVSDPEDTAFMATPDISEGWYIDDVELVRTMPAAAAFGPGDLLYSHVPFDGGSGWTATLDPTYPIDYIVADYFSGVTAPIGTVVPIGFAATYPWANADPTPGMIFNVFFYDEPQGTEPDWANPVAAEYNIAITSADMNYLGPFWGGSYDCWEFEVPLSTSVSMVSGYVGWQNVYPSPANCWFLSLNAVAGADDNQAWQYGSGVLTADAAFQLLEGGMAIEIEYDGVNWSDDFERENIHPWRCEKTAAGDYWQHHDEADFYLPNGTEDPFDEEDGWWVCHDYPGTDKGLNDVLYTEIDLTDDELTYAELFFAVAWYMEEDCEAFIEISTDYSEGGPMHDATWIPFWYHKSNGDKSSNGWITSEDLVNDDRFVINQYIGNKVFLRFRYTTPGEGFGVEPDKHGFAVDGLALEVKREVFVDEESPVTSICFDSESGEVSLLAVDYPLNKGCGVKATYYKVDGGETITYAAPFTLGEGAHTIEYWSEDNCGNMESHRTANYVIDTTPPTVELTSPEDGKLYLFGSPIMDRILSSSTLCIGKVPCAADANDDTTGVAFVTFAFSNGDSGFDDTAPFTYNYQGMHFGELTITAVAIDGKGLVSAPDSTTVTVYSLGLF